MKTSLATLFCLQVVCVFFCSSSLLHASPWWKTADSMPPPDLEKILGSDLSAWKLTFASAARVTHAQEHVVLESTNLPYNLKGLTMYGSNVEVEVSFRLSPPEKRGAGLVLVTGIHEPENPEDRGLRFSVALSADHQNYSLNFSDPVPPDTNRPNLRLNYSPKPEQTPMLSMPDWVRRQVEYEIASLPEATEKWLTLRAQASSGGIRVYFNDRLIMERTRPAPDVLGFLRLELSPYAQLAMMKITPMPAIDAMFEPVRLDGYLNAALLNGKRVDRAELPLPGMPVRVNDVPFVFPKPNRLGNDHIDLAASWLQTGSLEGAFYPNGRGVLGRWRGALCENPARLTFSAPNARYNALHLICAADDDPTDVPVVTALFYRPNAGHPVAFSAKAPLFSARSTRQEALPVALEGGRKGRLYHLTIPLNPDQLGLFEDLPTLEFELTKETQLYRAYPDPMFYSIHGAGRPSGVHIYALTFEKPAVDVEFEPDAYGNIWVAPAQPRYNVLLKNRAATQQEMKLEFSITNRSAGITSAAPVKIIVPPNQTRTHSFALSPALYGYNTAVLKVSYGERFNCFTRNLAWLHADTRARGNWQPGQGPCFGFWNWGGGHETPPAKLQLQLMGTAGCESEIGSLDSAPEDEQKIAQQFGYVTYKAFGAGDHWITGALVNEIAAGNPVQAALTNMIGKLQKNETKPSALHKPTFLSFFPEPGIGPWAGGCWPDYWGEAPYQLSDADEKRYKNYELAFVAGAKEVKKLWPDIKRLMPHGDPLFPLLFLRRSAEVRALIDGMAVDIAGFERLPEEQLHQVAMHRLYFTRQEFLKAGITNPALPNYEGPIVPTKPGAVPPNEAADINVRNALIQLAYGVNPLLGAWPLAECANYWGEQHYGAGLCHRLPRIMPEPSYPAVAAMTRHLNRRNFIKWLPTGSISVYALQFRHFQTGEPVHVLWTIRGRRPVVLKAEPGAIMRVFDQMDNESLVHETNGACAVIVSPSPCFVYGDTNDLVVAALGEPDHSDAAPAQGAALLATLNTAKWKISMQPDNAYASNHYYHIRRTPSKMSAAQVSAPEACAKSGEAMAIKLEPPEVDRKIMPFYSSLIPSKPIRIPGKASHLGLWVRAACDWGRVVYCLRDARGERRISVGTKNEWNDDDVHSWSYFCFDGWRYLRFELPANSPWDAYRENGSTWWGSMSPGDGIVDLPLTLEKIIIERRTHAMYVNDPQPASQDDVLLGDLYAEYAAPTDSSDETVKLSRLRMPLPKDVPNIANPIAELAASGVGEPPRALRVEPPSHEFDGTRCLVFFDEVASAKSYEVWVSPYKDGRGAVQLAKDWAKPGNLLRGLRPDLDFYVFVIARAQDGGHSKPSEPLRINLSPTFSFK